MKTPADFLAPYKESKKTLVSLLIEVVELVENIVLVSDVVVVVATKMKIFFL
jgi:hypothetical protein